MCSDWLLKLGTLIYMLFTCLHFFWISPASFPSFLSIKGTIWCWLSTGPLVCYIRKQLFTSVSVKSRKYLPRTFAAQQISTTILLHFSGALNEQFCKNTLFYSIRQEQKLSKAFSSVFLHCWEKIICSFFPATCPE